MTEEMQAARRGLAIARERDARYQAAYGFGRRDRDLERRLRDALRRVRHLEMLEAEYGMLAA